MLSGIDISTDQGDIDWSALKASGQVDFVFAKATEGITYSDDRFAQYHDGAKAHGIPFGAYHFIRFNDDPTAMAQHFLSTIEGRHGDLVPMVDVEETDGNSLERMKSVLAAFNIEVEKTLNGKKVLLYTYYSFWNQDKDDNGRQIGMAGVDDFSGHPLWIAAYNNDSNPPVPNGFKSALMWQHSSTGSVSGISGNVDLDRLYGDITSISR
jgi:lysozyme